MLVQKRETEQTANQGHLATLGYSSTSLMAHLSSSPPLMALCSRGHARPARREGWCPQSPVFCAWVKSQITRFQSVNQLSWNFQAVVVHFLGCFWTLISGNALNVAKSKWILIGPWVTRPQMFNWLGAPIMSCWKKNGTASEQPVQHHIPPHHTHRPYHIPAYPGDPFGGTSSKARNIGIVFEARLRRNSGIQYYPIITPGSFLEFTVNSHMRQCKSY